MPLGWKAPFLTLPYRTSPRFASLRLISPHFASLCLTFNHLASLRLQTYFFDPSLLPFDSVFSLFHVSISFYYDFFTFVMSIWHLHAPVFSLFHLHTSYNRNVQLQPKPFELFQSWFYPFVLLNLLFALCWWASNCFPKKKLQTPHLQMLMVQNMMLFFFLCVRGRC